VSTQVETSIGNEDCSGKSTCHILLGKQYNICFVCNSKILLHNRPTRKVHVFKCLRN
jgi:DNA-directed RNA polymerase subunit RPC12/RpoP